MVEASSFNAADLRAIFAEVSFQKIPAAGQQGNPAVKSEVVEKLKIEKGKSLSDNAKQIPAECKAVSARAMANDPDNGFEGAKFEGKKTGKAKQYYKDGSYYDGFMLEDNMVKGRFYFSNGDFYQGTFENNEPKTGQYQQASDPQFKCEQTTFVDSKPEGAMDKAQKITVQLGEKVIGLMGSFKNGQPVGEIQVSVDGTTLTVESEGTVCDLTEAGPTDPVKTEVKPQPVEMAGQEPAPQVTEEVQEQTQEQPAAPVEEVKPVETKSSKKKGKGKNNKQAAQEATPTPVEENTPSQPSKLEAEETKKPVAASSDNTDFDAKIAAMERENKDVMAKKEQEVGKLQAALQAKEREVEALKQQNADALKNQADQTKTDKENAKHATASKKHIAELDTQRQKIEELKQSLAESTLKQKDLMTEAVKQASLKRKAEEEKIALDVTKSEFVVNALRFAIMRGRQQKVIEQANADQKKLEQSIGQSAGEIDTLKKQQQDSSAEVARLTKLEKDLKAKVTQEKAERERIAAEQEKAATEAESSNTRLQEIESQNEESKRQLESALEERKGELEQGKGELKSTLTKMKELQKQIKEEKKTGQNLKDDLSAKEIEQQKVSAQLKDAQIQVTTLQKEKDKMQSESQKEQSKLKSQMAASEKKLKSELMQAQNKESQNQQKETQLGGEIDGLKNQLAQAEEAKKQFEIQVESLLEYNRQVKNIEVQEMSLKKQRANLDSKQKALESEDKRQKQNEESLRKEQGDWKAVNTKRQNQLESELQSKIKSFADQESEYVQKWESLKKDQASYEANQSEQSGKIDQLKQEAEDEITKVHNKRKEVELKEKRLQEERQTVRKELDSKINKHEGELQRLAGSERTKLLVFTSVAFVLGLALAMVMGPA